MLIKKNILRVKLTLQLLGPRTTRLRIGCELQILIFGLRHKISPNFNGTNSKYTRNIISGFKFMFRSA